MDGNMKHVTNKGQSPLIDGNMSAVMIVQVKHVYYIEFSFNKVSLCIVFQFLKSIYSFPSQEYICFNSHISNSLYCFYINLGILVHRTVLWIKISYECYVLTLFSSSAFLSQSPTSLRSEEYRQLFRLPTDEVSDLRVM